MFDAHDAKIAAHEVHKVRGVAVIQHSESVTQPYNTMVAPKRVVGDRMEGATCDALHVSSGSNRADSVEDLLRGTPSEGEQQDAFGIDSLIEQVLDACGQGSCFAGAWTCDDAKRPVTE
jgi:hypothetical protein